MPRKPGLGYRPHEVRQRVILARRLHREGFSAPAIAEMMGVDLTTVYGYLGWRKRLPKAVREVEEMEKSSRCPLCGSPAMVTLLQLRDFLQAALGRTLAQPSGNGASPQT